MVSALGQLTVIDCHLNQLKIYLKEFQADQPQKANQLNKELKKKWLMHYYMHVTLVRQKYYLCRPPIYPHPNLEPQCIQL